MTVCNRSEACQRQWQWQQGEALDLYEGPRIATNFAQPGLNKTTRMHGQLGLTMPQALAEGQAEGQTEGQEAVIQTEEDQEEGPSLAEGQEGGERKTRASRCWPDRWMEQYPTYRSRECAAWYFVFCVNYAFKV